MLITPYSTTVCQPHPVQRITNAIIRADIEAPLPVLTTPLGNQIQDAYYIPPKDEYADVPGFTQFVNIGKPGGAPKWVLDGRPYMRWDRRTDSYRLTAENDYSFQCTRLALTQLLASGQGILFHRLGDLPHKAFVRWITLAVSSRFGLSLDYQLRVSVIAAYYYLTQLQEDLTLTPESRQRYANLVSRITAVPTPLVLEIAEPLGDLNSAPALAEQLALHSGSLRLEEFKFTDLFLVLANSWVGVNARENVGVALEHMPTFIAMLYAALGERSYRKTILAARGESAGRVSDIKQFVDAVFRHVQTRFA